MDIVSFGAGLIAICLVPLAMILFSVFEEEISNARNGKW